MQLLKQQIPGFDTNQRFKRNVNITIMSKKKRKYQENKRCPWSKTLFKMHWQLLNLLIIEIFKSTNFPSFTLHILILYIGGSGHDIFIWISHPYWNLSLSLSHMSTVLIWLILALLCLSLAPPKSGKQTIRSFLSSKPIHTYNQCISFLSYMLKIMNSHAYVARHAEQFTALKFRLSTRMLILLTFLLFANYDSLISKNKIMLFSSKHTVLVFNVYA